MIERKGNTRMWFQLCPLIFRDDNNEFPKPHHEYLGLAEQIINQELDNLTGGENSYLEFEYQTKEFVFRVVKWDKISQHWAIEIEKKINGAIYAIQKKNNEK